MERTPEPELMDGEEQARAYAQADFREPHDRFVALLQESLPDLPEAGTALDLGCGPADVTLRFARAFPLWSVEGLDASEPMLRLGRAGVEAAGLSARVSLHQAHLPEADAPRSAYDLVFSNSLLHHLRDPSALWRCVRRWAPPGAAVFLMDLLRPENRAEAQRLVDLHCSGEPEILRRDFFLSLLAAYRPDEVRAQLEAAGLGYLSLRVASDRHLVVWGTRRRDTLPRVRAGGR
jgi:SAM-dependent methyltransferase